MGDEVGDGPVDLVTDAGDDRDREGCDGPCDRLGVEHGELVAAAATSDEHDHVDGASAERDERAHHRVDRFDALHSAVGQEHVPRQAARFELVHEVSVGGRSAACHEPDAQRHREA